MADPHKCSDPTCDGKMDFKPTAGDLLPGKDLVFGEPCTSFYCPSRMECGRWADIDLMPEETVYRCGKYFGSDIKYGYCQQYQRPDSAYAGL